MRRRPIRTAILVVVTAFVWFVAFKVSFPSESPTEPAATGRHLPPIMVGPGTRPVAGPDLPYTFTVPAGFAVEPRTGALLPESWLPTGARITHQAAEAAVDTDGIASDELAASAEANPGGPTPAERGVVEEYELGGFRVIVTGSDAGPGARVHTAYHGRTVVTFTSVPPDPAVDAFDAGVFPAAVDLILGSLEFG